MAAAETTTAQTSTASTDNSITVTVTVRVPRDTEPSLTDEVEARMTRAVGSNAAIAETHALQPKADGVYVTATVGVAGDGVTEADVVSTVAGAPCIELSED